MTIRKINYTVIAPEVEQDIKDKYTKDEINDLLLDKVDNSRVPIDAEFTDTVTTINGKTGEISKEDIVALGIPAQDTIYIHPTESGYKHIPSGGVDGQFLRWSEDGVAVWAIVPGGLVLGETSANAYRGDLGKVAYEHSQSEHAPVDAGLIIP